MEEYIYHARVLEFESFGNALITIYSSIREKKKKKRLINIKKNNYIRLYTRVVIIFPTLLFFQRYKYKFVYRIEKCMCRIIIF